MPGAPWSAPLPRDVLRIESLSEELDAAALGVAMAFSALLDSYTTPGWLPAVIDEHVVPLCGLMAPVPSFCFTTKDRGILPVRIMHQFVSLLIERLQMTVGELVTAYACVEHVLIMHQTTMRVNSVRPMLLGACVIVSKTSCDADVTLSVTRACVTFLTLTWSCSPGSSTRCSICCTGASQRASPTRRMQRRFSMWQAEN